ncbi:MAG: molybdopterin cofactor-binding domain-containing protein [Dysosmobacter sp.]
MECDGWTVFTNRPAAGAMRGYGMPQASFADEANIDECAAAVGMDPLEYRHASTSCPRIIADGLLQQCQLFRLLPGLPGKGP